ncbi:MAG: AAA family ATPase [Patescibacteria group bacterium]|jgi:predicted kinase
MEGQDPKNLSDNKLKDLLVVYEKKLIVPKKKLSKQIIICPVGLVGAGKTTVIKPLSHKLSLLRISADEIRQLLKENGYNYNRNKEMVFTVALKYLKQGFSIALDTNCASEEAQVYLKKIKNRFKVKIIWLHVNPPEQFIIKKLRNYKHTWLFENSDQAVRNYYRTKSLYKNLNRPFLYTFDPSKNLARQLKEAITLIKNFD